MTEVCVEASDAMGKIVEAIAVKSAKLPPKHNLVEEGERVDVQTSYNKYLQDKLLVWPCME